VQREHRRIPPDQPEPRDLLMSRPRLIDQDTALWELGLWPYEGRTMRELNEEERRVIYKLRLKLSHMAPFAKLPGIEGRRYRTNDIDKLIERLIAA